MTDPERDDPPKMAWNYAKSFLEILAIVFLLVLARIYGTPYLQTGKLQGFIAGLGFLAPLAFMLISAFVVMIPVPTMLAIATGSLAFGKVAGASYSLIGITFGACVAFLVGRHLIGDAAKTKQRYLLRMGLKKADELLKRRSLLAIIGLRLALFSNLILNYTAGSTPMALRDFFLGTFIGLIPKTFIMSYIFGMLGTPSSGNLLTNPNLWLLAILPSTRICGVVMLGLLARNCGGEIE